ncbi:hypothetical protein COOONC_27326, partial [Cooperia oncophora]
MAYNGSYADPNAAAVAAGGDAYAQADPQALKEYEAAWAQYYASLGQTVPPAPGMPQAQEQPGGNGAAAAAPTDYSGYYANGSGAQQPPMPMGDPSTAAQGRPGGPDGYSTRGGYEGGRGG